MVSNVCSWLSIHVVANHFQNWLANSTNYIFWIILCIAIWCECVKKNDEPPAVCMKVPNTRALSALRLPYWYQVLPSEYDKLTLCLFLLAENKANHFTPQTTSESTASVGTIERQKSQILKIQDELKTVRKVSSYNRVPLASVNMDCKENASIMVILPLLRLRKNTWFSKLLS